MCGEDVVGIVVLAIEIETSQFGRGRKVASADLQSKAAFFDYLKQSVRSAADNFRRHAAAQIWHEPIRALGEYGPLYEPADAFDLDKHVALRDLWRVILPRVRQELENKPQQLELFFSWAASLNQGDCLPKNGGSKFNRHCLRTLFRKQLLNLAAQDLGKDSTGKELLM